MKKHYRHENNCLNCGTDLQGKYCHHCGQENLEIKESFGHMVNHAVSDYFHFDHQFFHTLRPLFFAPGKLTNEYMAGKRMQFLHPVKMYIFISLVFFLLLFRHGKEEKQEAMQQTTNQQLTDTLTAAINKNTQIDSSTRSDINKSIAVGIAFANKDKKKKHDDNDAKNYAPDGTYLGRGGVFHMTQDSSYEDYLKRQQTLPDSSKDNWIERIMIKKNFDYNKYGKRATEILWDEFKHNVPKLMFLLLPLFALILKIAFFKNHKFYVEHLIYSIHLHCFVFVFITIYMLVTMFIPHTHGWKTVTDWIELISTFTILFYIYKSLRTVYHRSRRRTISKMFGVGFAYVFAFGFSALLIAIITAYNVG